MVVVLKKDASLKEISEVMKFLENAGIKIHVSKGEQRTIFGLIGELSNEIKEQLMSFSAVEEIVRITKPYKLASKEFKSEPTIIKINGNFIISFGVLTFLKSLLAAFSVFSSLVLWERTVFIKSLNSSLFFNGLILMFFP